MLAFALALTVGLSLTLLVWSVYSIFAAVPEEDRSYLDRPPVGFRLSWPLIRLMVYYLGPRLSMKYRKDAHQRLRSAGVDYSLSPEQFFAGKLLAAFAFGAFSFLVLKALDSPAWYLVIFSALGGFYYPELWLKETRDRRHKDIFRALPFYLDIITLAVEAGTNLTGAFTQAVQKSPPGPLKTEINRVLRDVRAGKSRAEAMRAMADRIDMTAINTLVSSLVQAEIMGSTLGPVLRAQADQRRIERFQRAEKLAMEAPVKLLGPLIMFIFPNFFIVLVFLLISKSVQEGVVSWAPLVKALTWPG